MYIVSRFQMLTYRDWTLSFEHFAVFFILRIIFANITFVSYYRKEAYGVTHRNFCKDQY